MSRNRIGIFLCILSLLCFSGCVQDRGARKSEAQAKQNLGMALLAGGNRQAALKNLLEAAELDPDNETLHDAIGLAYGELEQFDKATLHLNRALQIKPNYSDAMNHLGMVFSKQGKHAQAIELFRKAAEDFMYPSRHAAYDNLGLVHLGLRQYDQALEAFKRSVQILPNYSEAYDHMGMAYEGLQQWDRAIDSYSAAIRVAPDFPVSYLYLANVYLKLNRREEARKSVLKAMELDKNGDFSIDTKRFLLECDRRG